ncbi:hypothetical protein COLO4_21845 [Corchorus olitorius]|uniref:Endonuclease/exonuclease/phosphatase n=1 Tax=Corchorus olitorius TaxID=93759 RepID=A0A1R3IQE0_9ROSI|nr:hypothetical protein COLO4_21845 [Corchorus olitorius]
METKASVDNVIKLTRSWGFQNYVASDHSPLLLQFDKQDGFRRRPYRFEMMWSTNERCEEVIKESWNQEVVGSDAYRLVQKIKITRDELKRWNKTEFGNIFQRKQALEKELEEIQTNIERAENQMKEPLKKRAGGITGAGADHVDAKIKNKLDSTRRQEYKVLSHYNQKKKDKEQDHYT